MAGAATEAYVVATSVRRLLMSTCANCAAPSRVSTAAGRTRDETPWLPLEGNQPSVIEKT